MTETDELDDGACPDLRPNVGEPPTLLTVAVYCGLPGGRARVPSRDELIRFCVAGHHGDCPGYRLARLGETFAAGVA